LTGLGNHTHNRKETKLTETSALGQSGVYYDTNWNENGLLSNIQHQIFNQLNLDAGHGPGVLPSTNDKAIVLIYTLNGENWSHQDDNRDFKYQAVIMLSEPKRDFNGGETYVLSDAKEAGKNVHVMI